MNVTNESTVSPMNCQPEMVLIRARDLQRVRQSCELLHCEVAGNPGVPLAIRCRVGELAGQLDIAGIYSEAMGPGLSIWDEPAVEAEPIQPSPADIQWATEHTLPCRAPETPQDLLRILADTLEALGLDPDLTTGQDRDPYPGSIWVELLGRDYRLECCDMTAQLDDVERQSWEHDQANDTP